MAAEEVDVWFVDIPEWGASKGEVNIVCIQGSKTAKLVKFKAGNYSGWHRQMSVEKWEAEHRTRAIAIATKLDDLRLQRERASDALTELTERILKLLEVQ